MIKPKLALIPAAQGSKLYSVLPSSGVGDFDFTRGTVATRVNKDGLIETVGSGVSRLNYPLIDGVVNGCPSHILEPTKTNFIQYSEDFTTNWVNNGASIITNQIISPSGDLSADLLTGVSGGFGLARFSMWSATNKVASCFAKKGSSNIFKISNASFSYIGVTFNLENGTVTNEDSGFEGSIENYGNGWYRCTAIDTSARSGTFNLGVTAASESIYVWGAQMESGSYSTSYIPTVVSTVTRSAETANGSGDASTFNDSEGVLMAECSLVDDGSFGTAIEISNNENLTTDFYLIYKTSSNGFSARVRIGNSNILEINTPTGLQEGFYKLAFVYNSINYSFFVNGFKVGNVLSSDFLSNLNVIQQKVGSANPFYGSTKQIQYYDTALNDTDLETLTSWVSFTDMANGQLYTIE